MFGGGSEYRIRKNSVFEKSLSIRSFEYTNTADGGAVPLLFAFFARVLTRQYLYGENAKCISSFILIGIKNIPHKSHS